MPIASSRKPAAQATRDVRASTAKKPASAPLPSRAPSRLPRARGPGLVIPRDADDVDLPIAARVVRLTNLRKPFWPELGLTKRDLLQYCADVAPALLPHLVDRAMVMKRYPNGATGPSFFMKRAPTPRPGWVATCSIAHASGSVIDFPMVQDLPSLLWLVNLGCIDLNPWYARCDDVDRPDFLHFDLDPVPEATFALLRKAALVVRDALVDLGMRPLVKTTGSRGFHLYVAIARGPTQKDVWRVAKTIAKWLERQHPALLTAEYRVAARPAGRVLVDYNQNAWGRTLASVYSVRPRPRASVSTPLTWDEVEGGAQTDDFRIDNLPQRLRAIGDLWAPLLHNRHRFNLARLSGSIDSLAQGVA